MGLCLATQIPALGIPGDLGRPGRALSELKGDRAPRTKQELQAQKLQKCGSSQVLKQGASPGALGRESWEEEAGAGGVGGPAPRLLKLSFSLVRYYYNVCFKSEKMQICRRKEKE